VGQSWKTNVSFTSGDWAMLHQILPYVGRGEFLVMSGQSGAVVFSQVVGTSGQEDPVVHPKLFHSCQQCSV
jgi:hypothetical protein